MLKHPIFLFVLLPSSVLAQDRLDASEQPDIVIADQVRDTSIVVVANGDTDTLDTTGQPISIIGAEEIERVQGPDMVRVVERLPGVALTRNGGPGGFTALRVRGAEAEQLLVLMDGVRVADAAAPAGGFDFGTLLPAGAAKIELLRGANSTIWGSQAMGGVLSVETLAFDGFRGSAEYGGPESAYAQASAGQAGGRFNWAVDGAFYDSQGISSAAVGSEPDGVLQWQAGSRASVQVMEGLTVRAAARHVDARVELDGFPAPDYVLADTREYQDTRRTDVSGGLEWHRDHLDLRATWSLSDTERESFDPALGTAPSYTTDGRDERAEFRGHWRFADNLSFRFGGEREWNRMATLVDVRERTHSTGGYAQFGYRAGASLLNVGLRVEDHARFGTTWTFGTDGAISLGSGWRVRGSYGEGFKAPTLFQLLSDYGNPLLRPERSRGFDLGLEQGDRNSGLHLAVSAFRRDSLDLIDFVSCFGETSGICADRPLGTYDNVGKARAHGGEIEVAFEAVEGLQFRGAYSYVEAKNRTPGSANQGNDLARRPRHAATVSASWATRWKAVLDADLRIVSGSYDDAANLVRLGGYQIVTLRASFPLGGAVDLFARVENALDERYQTAAGYGSPGRGAYVGARSRF